MATDSGEETGRDATRATELAARDAVMHKGAKTQDVPAKAVTREAPATGGERNQTPEEWSTVMRMPLASASERDAALGAARAAGADAAARDGARGPEVIVRERGDGSSVRAAARAVENVRKQTAFERECMDMQKAARAMAGAAAPVPVQERTRSL